MSSFWECKSPPWNWSEWQIAHKQRIPAARHRAHSHRHHSGAVWQRCPVRQLSTVRRMEWRGCVPRIALVNRSHICCQFLWKNSIIGKWNPNLSWSYCVLGSLLFNKMISVPQDHLSQWFLFFIHPVFLLFLCKSSRRGGRHREIFHPLFQFSSVCNC